MRHYEVSYLDGDYYTKCVYVQACSMEEALYLVYTHTADCVQTLSVQYKPKADFILNGDMAEEFNSQDYDDDESWD